jgi:hypothetical protein
MLFLGTSCAGGVIMFIYVQAVLAAVGAAIALRGRFPVGRREITNPVALTVGVLLLAPLLVCYWFGFIAEVFNAYTSAWPSLAPPKTPQPEAASLPWVDMMISLVSLMLAGGITAMSLQEEGLPKMGEPQPVPETSAEAPEALATFEPSNPPSDAVTDQPRTDRYGWTNGMDRFPE